MSPIPGCRPLLHMPPLRCGRRHFVGPLGPPYALECSGVLTMAQDTEEKRSKVAMDGQLCWSCGVVTSYCMAGSLTTAGCKISYKTIQARADTVNLEL